MNQQRLQLQVIEGVQIGKLALKGSMKQQQLQLQVIESVLQNSAPVPTA